MGESSISMIQIAFCQHFHHIIHAILNTCAADDSTQNHCQETFFSALFAFPPMTFNPNSPSLLANNGVALSLPSPPFLDSSFLSSSSLLCHHFSEFWILFSLPLSSSTFVHSNAHFNSFLQFRSDDPGEGSNRPMSASVCG